eukprot:Gb_09627 [translate_table: standard]
MATIGERNLHSQSEKRLRTLKEQLAIITPQLEELRLKEERVEQFIEVHPSLHESTPGQSTNISNETLEGLFQTIQSLQDEKKHRIQ